MELLYLFWHRQQKVMGGGNRRQSPQAKPPVGLHPALLFQTHAENPAWPDSGKFLTTVF
jgi:hypothetical protein